MSCIVLYSCKWRWLEEKRTPMLEENMKHHKSSNECIAVHVCPSTLHSGLMSLIGQPGLCQTDPLRKGCRSDRGQFGDVTNSFLSNIWDVQFTSGMSSFLLKLTTGLVSQSWLPNSVTLLMAGNGCCMRNVGSRDCPLSMTWKRSSMWNMYNHSHHSQVHGALNLQRQRKKSRRVSEETLPGFVSINYPIPSFNQLEIYGQNPAPLQMCICTYHYDLSVITVPFIIKVVLWIFSHQTY